MTRSRYGMLAGLAGAAFATWWWRRRRTASMARGMSGAHHHGETIFSNAPVVG